MLFFFPVSFEVSFLKDAFCPGDTISDRGIFQEDLVAFQGILGIFTARNRGGEELCSGFQIMFKPSELSFPDEGWIPSNLLVPGVRDQLVKAFLMDPKGAESKGNGPQVFFRAKIKEDRLMIGETIWEYFGGRMKPQREEGGVHQKPVKRGCNVPRP